MRARRYTTKIEIWRSTQVDDGYGGTTPLDVLISSNWANKTTQGAGYKFQQYGLNDFKNPVIFRIRKGNVSVTEDMFVRYSNNDFIIKGIENVDLNNRELNLYCDET